MNTFLSLSEEQKRDAIMIVANRRGLSPIIVEKDFWVTYILATLFEKSQFRNRLVFKGGTSLAKGYKVIQRFSEDIDLILDWRSIGFDDNTPWTERSNTQQQLFNQLANEKAATWIKETLLQELTSLISQDISKFSLAISEEDAQTILFNYHSVINEKELGVKKLFV